jgi:hypothetical protein
MAMVGHRAGIYYGKDAFILVIEGYKIAASFRIFGASDNPS